MLLVLRTWEAIDFGSFFCDNGCLRRVVSNSSSGSSGNHATMCPLGRMQLVCPEAAAEYDHCVDRLSLCPYVRLSKHSCHRIPFRAYPNRASMKTTTSIPDLDYVVFGILAMRRFLLGRSCILVETFRPCKAAAEEVEICAAHSFRCAMSAAADQWLVRWKQKNKNRMHAPTSNHESRIVNHGCQGPESGIFTIWLKKVEEKESLYRARDLRLHTKIGSERDSCER